MHSPGDRPLALVTCSAHPRVSADDRLLQQALSERGIVAVAAAWNDAAIDWTRFSGLVVRSAWDYHLQYQNFRHWLGRIESLGIRAMNPVETIRWNADKHYLLQLAGHGASVIPTRIVLGADLRAAVDPWSGQRIVVKPAVSGSAWRTIQGIAGSDELDRGIESLPAQRWYLVQPYLAEIERDGEWSLVFFGGEFSHAVRKLPAAGDYRVQESFGGRVIAEVPPQDILAAARSCLGAVALAGHGNHAYARVDGVVSMGAFRLMEVELIEPVLFLGSHRQAAARFADALVASLGLGYEQFKEGQWPGGY